MQRNQIVHVWTGRLDLLSSTRHCIGAKCLHLAHTQGYTIAVALSSKDLTPAERGDQEKEGRSIGWNENIFNETAKVIPNVNVKYSKLYSPQQI